MHRFALPWSEAQHNNICVKHSNCSRLSSLATLSPHISCSRRDQESRITHHATTRIMYSMSNLVDVIPRMSYGYAQKEQSDHPMISTGISCTTLEDTLKLSVVQYSYCIAHTTQSIWVWIMDTSRWYQCCRCWYSTTEMSHVLCPMSNVRHRRESKCEIELRIVGLPKMDAHQSDLNKIKSR